MQSLLFFFFFSSRRRHTRSTRDWSSDVCSSDLTAAVPASRAGGVRGRGAGKEHPERGSATGAVLDPGASAVEVGELGDQRQADPRAGRVGGDVAALMEGLEDLLAEL